MSRVGKLYERLDTLEASFRTELAQELGACAVGRNDLLFAAREFLPAGFPKSIPTTKADDLLAQVEVIRGLREKLKEPFRQSPAFAFLECCRKWADTSDEHRGSAQTIAQRLLAELGAPR